MPTRLLALACIALAAGCASGDDLLRDNTPPEVLLGTFVDDYGIAYSIAEREWVQRPEARYRVRLWRPDASYLIAQNAETNPSDGGLWTRIDWVRLDGMAPYEWAFCLSAYDAPTAAAAESTRTAQPHSPRTGCGGHPFSRMRRATAADTSDGDPNGY